MAEVLRRRVVQAGAVIVLAFTATFLLLQAMPADALMIRFENPELGLSPEQIADLRVAYGADAPLPVQFWHTASGFLRGDFGYSIATGASVRTLLADALPHTLGLAGLGFATALVLAFAIALAAATAPFAWLGRAIRSLPPLLVSVPVFWLGVVLIQVFSFTLGLISVINPGPVESLILPVATLAVPIAAPLAQVLLRSIDEVRTQPFVPVTRATGASAAATLWGTVLRNALPPTLALAGVLLGELIGGAVVTETVYGRAGLGRVTEAAVRAQDVPVLQAVVVLAALVFVVVTLLVDLIAPLLDPRLRGAS